MVVEVITECLDMGYGFLSSLRGEMAGEEDYSQLAPHIPNKPLRRAYQKLYIQYLRSHHPSPPEYYESPTAGHFGKEPGEHSE